MGNDRPYIPVSVFPDADSTDLSSASSVLTLLIIVKLAQHLLTHGSTSSVLMLLTRRSVPQLLARDVRNSLFFLCRPICLSSFCIDRLSLFRRFRRFVTPLQYSKVLLLLNRSWQGHVALLLYMFYH
jgi:hypothetical protein